MGQRKRISNQSYDTILKIIEGNRLGIIEVGPSKKHLQPRLRSSSTGNDFKEKESFERDEEEHIVREIFIESDILSMSFFDPVEKLQGFAAYLVARHSNRTITSLLSVRNRASNDILATKMAGRKCPPLRNYSPWRDSSNFSNSDTSLFSRPSRGNGFESTEFIIGEGIRRNALCLREIPLRGSNI